MGFFHVSRLHVEYLHDVHLKATAMNPHSYVAAHQQTEMETGKDEEGRSVGVVIQQPGLEAKNGWIVLERDA